MLKRMISASVLRAVVFTCGAVVMILELDASRIIAPYLGTSIVIWTSLIGIILGSLSLGYWWGGKLADTNPSVRKLSVIILVAALFSGTISYFKPILGVISGMDNLQASALLATLILFAPATVVLGVVTPYAARLSLSDIANSGKTIGNLYALSTLGSIVGTFLGGFVLISFFGSTKILVILSLALGLCSLSLFLVSGPERRETPYLSLFLLLIIPIIFPAPGVIVANGGSLVADMDTNYNRMWVYDLQDSTTKRPARYLTNTVEVVQSGIFIDHPTELLDAYEKFFDLAADLYPSFTSTAMIGAGSYSYPMHFAEVFPHASMKVIEIDPKLTSIAKEYFYYAEPKSITTINEDGRTFLNNNTEKFQIVYMDAFLSYWTVPFQLTTQETVRRIRDSLTDDGIVFTNILGGVTGASGEFFRAEYATYASVFPFVYAFRVSPETPTNKLQNVVLMASNTDLSHKIAAARTRNPLFDRLMTDRVVRDVPVLTDDFAPVEFYNSKGALLN
jgi:spermidine synthase